MKFYFMSGLNGSKYFDTFKAAKKAAQQEALDDCNTVTVTKVEVPASKANILRLLNNEGGHTIYGRPVYQVKGKLKMSEQ